ncbi:LysR substrate-binding domain-containing protein [Roseibium album]|uniref:HTH-type transcriptional activator CmpR n=1 Tax=Roseibium album TaxID=311410 RepID=A0A0M7A3Z3_9HYPH|nr:LysR substrate-binding domain-containing protein [Roseibium album]CTQ63201.1 HTH-type transcriptional activator CmpR [Roseibium album]CTQ69202.1 HTH-type transcriptional activator CmpR [Roseibium album]CTQ80856.1 HTH-type transcriptional activator CmpR [Roseibium album]
MLKSELRAFHAVARFGGFSNAAKACNVSQPTLSTQVKALERRYKVELFNRVGREVHLTGPGKELMEITSRLVQAETDAESLLNSYRGFHAGALNLAAVGPFHATDMIVAYKQNYPGIDVQVKFGNSTHCFEQILSFDADVGIIAEVPVDERVTTLLYSVHEVVAFVNSDHHFYDRASISIHELEGEKTIRREAGSTTRTAIERELDNRNVKVDAVLELGSREAIWKAVEQGLGLGFVADFEFVPHPNLRPIPITDADIQTNYYLAFLKEREQSRLINSFCDVALGRNGKKSTWSPVA